MPRHRRRGLATHLLVIASAWAWDQGARRVIIVDAGSDAARLDQTAGFAPPERGFNAYAEILGAAGRCFAARLGSDYGP